MEANKIYNEDCLIGMKNIPDKSIDCIICDLPYGVLNKKSMSKWDSVIHFESLWNEYKRIIKNNGAIVLLFAFMAVTCYAQNDSIGIYSNVEGVYKPIAPIHYRQTKIGIGKAANIFCGSTSPNRFKGVAEFRLYFRPLAPGDTQHYMFSDSYSITDYGVGEFKVKKDSRQLSVVRGSIFNMQTGTPQSGKVNMRAAAVRPGVYDITVTGKPGEYCIMVTRAGVGAYYGVYDFTLEK